EAVRVRLHHWDERHAGSMSRSVRIANHCVEIDVHPRAIDSWAHWRLIVVISSIPFTARNLAVRSRHGRKNDTQRRPRANARFAQTMRVGQSANPRVAATLSH